MSFIYTRAQFKSRINAKIQNRIGMLVSANDMMNEVVRKTFAEMDLRSAKRRATLTPDLSEEFFEYNCPADLKGNKIIDIPAQAKDTSNDADFYLTTPEEFRRHNGTRKGEIAIGDFNGQRVLYINADVNSKRIEVSTLDVLSAGASSNWLVTGDAESLAADDADFIRGNGSLKFNIGSGGTTTAGIYNENVNSLDISDYLGGTSSFMVYARITDPTNISSYSLEFGSSSSAYHKKTVTAQADGTAFVAGWNLLRFDIESLADTGTPDDENITYFKLYMNKTAGKVSESDYKFDSLVLTKGEIRYVHYYTKYGWQSSAGAYKENSTDDSDILVADTDEFDMLVDIGASIAASEAGLEAGFVDRKAQIAEKSKADYIAQYPSEAQLVTTSYYDY